MNENANTGYRNANHLRHLADRCDAGADELQRAADDPAGVLAERGYHDYADVQEWGARKAAAAAAAREYAAHLRTMADDPSYRAPAEQFAEAEKVATAAECDGILIDGSRLTESAIEHGWHDEAGKQALRDHQAAEDAAVEGSGMFGHVAETINGVEQVPVWQLGGNTDTDRNQPQVDSQDRGDRDADTPAAGQGDKASAVSSLTPDQGNLHRRLIAHVNTGKGSYWDILGRLNVPAADKHALADLFGPDADARRYAAQAGIDPGKPTPRAVGDHHTAAGDPGVQELDVDGTTFVNFGNPTGSSSADHPTSQTFVTGSMQTNHVVRADGATVNINTGELDTPGTRTDDGADGW